MAGEGGDGETERLSARTREEKGMFVRQAEMGPQSLLKLSRPAISRLDGSRPQGFLLPAGHDVRQRRAGRNHHRKSRLKLWERRGTQVLYEERH
jgi:hypothetical protein